MSCVLSSPDPRRPFPARLPFPLEWRFSGVGGRDRRRFERFAQMGEDLPDRPRFGDEGDQPDVAATRRALERKLLPTRARSFAQAIREVSCDRGFA